MFVTKLKIPSIVATLATTQIFSGAIQIIFKGSIYHLPPSFTYLGFNAKILIFIPLSVLIMLVITIISLIFMKYSRFSKKLYAIGNNPNGARLAGINVDATIIITYIIAVALFGIAATIIATLSQRVTTTMGTGLEMTFIAAVVLGGTSTSGGTGKILGSIIATIILSIISPAINYMGINPDWSDAIMGSIILASVIISAFKFIKK